MKHRRTVMVRAGNKVDFMTQSAAKEMVNNPV